MLGKYESLQLNFLDRNPWLVAPSRRNVVPFSRDQLFFGPKRPITTEIGRYHSADRTRQKTLFNSATGHGMAIFETFRLDAGNADGTVRQHICVPLSVGCPAGCTMCEVGDFFSQNLPPDHLVNAIDATLAGWFRGTEVTSQKIMFLGGGEIGFYPKASELLYLARERKHYAKIVISTVGVDTPILRQLEPIVAADHNMGIQVSVCSLSDDIRGQIVPHNKALSVQESLDYAAEMARNHGIKPHISIFMLKGIDTPQSIREQVNGLVDPQVHITLTDIVEASRRWQFMAASDEEYGIAARLLQQDGYQVSVYRPAVDATLYDSCGLYLPVTPDLNGAVNALNENLRRGDIDTVIDKAYAGKGKEPQVGSITFEQLPEMSIGKDLEVRSRFGIVVHKDITDNGQTHNLTVLTIAATQNDWRHPGMVTHLLSKNGLAA